MVYSLKLENFHWRPASTKFVMGVTDMSVIFDLISVEVQPFGEKKKKWKSQSVYWIGIFLLCKTYKQSQNHSTKFKIIFITLLVVRSRSRIF